jgi:hypothetical protein
MILELEQYLEVVQETAKEAECYDDVVEAFDYIREDAEVVVSISPALSAYGAFEIEDMEELALEAFYADVTTYQEEMRNG